MAIDFKAINWKSVFGKVAGIAAIAGWCYVQIKYGVGTDNNGKVIHFDDYISSSNPKAAAINALYRNAENDWSDSSKIRKAQGIAELITDETPDDIKTYAIKKLTGISNSMTFSSSKSAIADIISKIAKGE